MLINAFSDFDRGVYKQFHSDGRLFNLRRLKAKTKVFEAILHEFLFVDNYALAAHSHEDIQCMTDRFAAACIRFGVKSAL